MKRPQRICAPSRAIIRRNNVLTRNAADLKQRCAGIGVETAPMSAGEFGQLVRSAEVEPNHQGDRRQTRIGMPPPV